MQKATQNHLRLIDATKHGELITNVSIKQKAVKRGKTVDPEIVVLEDILSAYECQEVIQSATTKYGFTSLASSYLVKERQADRLCIIDEAFASSLWQLVQSHVPSNQIPFGFTTANEWVPIGINPCMRISRYQAPSVGFRPHSFAFRLDIPCLTTKTN